MHLYRFQKAGGRGHRQGPGEKRRRSLRKLHARGARSAMVSAIARYRGGESEHRHVLGFDLWPRQSARAADWQRPGRAGGGRFSAHAGRAGRPSGLSSVGDRRPYDGGQCVRRDLRRRCSIAQRTGEGQYIDLALVDCMYNSHDWQLAAFSATGGEVDPQRGGTQRTGAFPYGVFIARMATSASGFSPSRSGKRWSRRMGREDLLEVAEFKTAGGRFAEPGRAQADYRGMVRDAAQR